MKNYILEKKKKIGLFVLLFVLSVIFFIVMKSFLVNSINIINIKKFIDFKTLSLLIYIILFFFFSCLYVISELEIFKKSSKYKLLLYISLASGILITALAVFITRGNAFKTFLFVEVNDTFMDFYNSIQYGLKPYSRAVIYPPLINIVYAFIGHFVTIKDIIGTPGLRTSQDGQFVFAAYLLFTYIPFSLILFKLKKGHLVERYFFVFCVLFSLPFLYAFERANSIIWALFCMFLYIEGYQSKNSIIKIGSFFSLAIAAAIKISPALLGLLLVKERRWRDAIICAFIGGLVFMLPFTLTDGNISSLLNNIQNATANFQGYSIDGHGVEHVIGNGIYVNLINTGKFMSRLFNIDLMPVTSMLNLLFFILGISFVCMDKHAERWVSVGILCALMILCTGFSAIYNLTYISLPLMLFLDEHELKRKTDYLYIIIFIGIFIPFVNFKLSIFKTFNADMYPMRLTTFIESICLLVFIVSLLLEVARSQFLDKNECRCFFVRKMMYVVIPICLIMSGFIGFRSKAIHYFNPIGNDIANASKGFYMQNGRYDGITQNAQILILTQDLKDNGLMFSYVIDNKALQENGGNYEVQLFVNDVLLKKDIAVEAENNYIYITPQILKEHKVFDKESSKITILQSNYKSDCIHVNYIGPGKSILALNTPTDISKNVRGFSKDNDGNIRLTRKSTVLLDSNMPLNEGLEVFFSVPDTFYIDEKPSLVIEVNGKEARRINIEKMGNYIVNLLPKDVFTWSDYITHNPAEVSLYLLDANGNDVNLNFDKYIKINYIGPSKRIEELESNTDLWGMADGLQKDGSYLWMSEKVSMPFDFSTIKYLGLHVIYKITPDWFRGNNNQEFVLSLGYDHKDIGKQRTTFTKNDYLRYYHVYPEQIYNCNDLGTLFLMVNKTFSYHDIFARNDDFFQRGTMIKYIGSNNYLLDHVYSNSDIEKISDGLFLNEMKELTFNRNGKILLPKQSVLSKGLQIQYLVKDYLLQANKDKVGTLEIAIDGNNIKTIPVDKSGSYIINFGPEELRRYVNDNDSEAFCLGMQCNLAFNLKQLYLKNNEQNESISIQYIGI